MPKPTAALLAVVLLAVAGPALASEAGNATGTVTVGDQATPLTHVYAWEETDIPEMRFGDSPERRIVLLVLDRPLPANARADMASAVQLAIKGELRGIYLDLDAANGTPHNGALLARPEENPNSFTILGDGSDVVVENFHYEGGKLELASRSVKPLDLYDFSGSGGPSSFTFEATLEAPVEPAPALVATLEGEAASGSEQAVAIKALLEALEAEDAEKIRAAVLSDQPGSEMLATPEGIAQFKSMILGEGDAAAQMAKLTKVYVYETHAVVLFKEQEGGWSTMPVTEEDGRWKLGAP